MTNQAPNHLKYLLATKAVDFENDEFRIILMATGFVFNKDTHALYSDVSANELGAPSTSNGYAVGTKALAGVAYLIGKLSDAAV